MRTPEQIADAIERDYAYRAPETYRFRDLLIQAAREAQTAPDFEPEGVPDKFRDLYNDNMPRVSSCMWFAIPGEQPIHVDDDQARRILAMLSTEAAL